MERETLMCMRERETSISGSHMHPCWGLNLQPGFTPWRGTKPATFWWMGQQSNQRSHTATAEVRFLMGWFPIKGKPLAGVWWDQTSVSFLGLVWKWTTLLTHRRILCGFLHLKCQTDAVLMQFNMSPSWVTQPWPMDPPQALPPSGVQVCPHCCLRPGNEPQSPGDGTRAPALEANRVKHRQAGSQTTEAQVRSSSRTWQLSDSLSQQQEVQTHSKMASKDWDSAWLRWLATECHSKALERVN